MALPIANQQPNNPSYSLPGVLCDLDGVVWLSQKPIPGSVEAIAALRQAGHRVLFVTNSSYSLVATQEQYLAKIGIEAQGDVLTSATAAGMLIKPDQRVLVAGGPGIVEAVVKAGGVVAGRTDDGSSESDQKFTDANIDAVVVGFHRTFNFESMRRAAAAVQKGAQLIGTNDDPTFPTDQGIIPGGGSILAAIATASGAVPTIAGKPFSPMGDLVRHVLGKQSVADCWMVGDRFSTDGVFAKVLGSKFALVTAGLADDHEGERLQQQHGFAMTVPDLATFAIALGAKA